MFRVAGRLTFKVTTTPDLKPQIEQAPRSTDLKLERELQLAAQVQHSMLPHQFPDVPGFHFAAESYPADQLEGDFYDIFRLRNGRVGLLVGDVAGKDVSAALYMALTRSLIRAEAKRTRSPRRVLLRVHRLLLELTQADIFVTAFYGVLDPATGKLRYARAGHDRPLLASSNVQACQFLAASGIVLGSWDQVELEEAELQLHQGDTLVLYSDGITEALSPDGEQFGFGRLCDTVHAGLQLGAQELLEHTLQQVRSFQAEAPQHDDVTLVVVRVDGLAAAGGQT